jgi:AcrR family transcriptional regulator
MRDRNRAARIPATRKGLATRERIVTVASGLMLERGVAGTSVEDVMEAARVSSSQIYHYFGDKSGLVSAVIRYQTDTIVGGQEPMFAQFDTIAGLRRWRDFLVAHQRRLGYRGGCPLGSIASEVAEVDRPSRELAAAGFERWEAGIRAGLAAMHERGALTEDPDELALALLAALQGGLLLTKIQRDTRALESSLDVVIDHIAGLARQTAS